MPTSQTFDSLSDLDLDHIHGGEPMVSSMIPRFGRQVPRNGLEALDNFRASLPKDYGPAMGGLKRPFDDIDPQKRREMPI
jgi:hypothetical protein